ncbi:MAG: hypothetical protein SGPRY_004382 [Prymnesium sp.]
MAMPPQSGTGQPPQPGMGMPPQSGTGQAPQPGMGMPPQSGTGLPPQPGMGMPPQPGTGLPPQPGMGMPPQSGTGQPPQPGMGMPPQSGTGPPPQPGMGMPPPPGMGIQPQTGYQSQPGMGMPPQPGMSMPPQPGMGMHPQSSMGMHPQPGMGMPLGPGMSMPPRPGMGMLPQLGMGLTPQSGYQPQPGVGMQLQGNTPSTPPSHASPSDDFGDFSTAAPDDGFDDFAGAPSWACIPQRLMSMEASPERRLHLCRHLVRVLSSLKLHQRMYHQVRVVASSELLVHLCPHMVRMVASPLDPMVWELVEYGSLLHQMILGTSLLLPRDKESPLMRLVAFLLHPQYRRQNNLDCRLPKVVVLMNLGALLRGKAMIPCRRIRRAEQQLYRQMTLQAFASGGKQTAVEQKVSASAQEVGLNAGSEELGKGSQAYYKDRDGITKLATIVKVHYDEPPPYYTISIDGNERSTVREKLIPLQSGGQLNEHGMTSAGGLSCGVPHASPMARDSEWGGFGANAGVCLGSAAGTDAGFNDFAAAATHRGERSAVFTSQTPLNSAMFLQVRLKAWAQPSYTGHKPIPPGHLPLKLMNSINLAPSMQLHQRRQLRCQAVAHWVLCLQTTGAALVLLRLHLPDQEALPYQPTAFVAAQPGSAALSADDFDGSDDPAPAKAIPGDGSSSALPEDAWGGFNAPAPAAAVSGRAALRADDFGVFDDSAATHAMHAGDSSSGTLQEDDWGGFNAPASAAAVSGSAADEFTGFDDSAATHAILAGDSSSGALPEDDWGGFNAPAPAAAVSGRAALPADDFGGFVESTSAAAFQGSNSCGASSTDDWGGFNDPAPTHAAPSSSSLGPLPADDFGDFGGAASVGAPPNDSFMGFGASTPAPSSMLPAVDFESQPPGTAGGIDEGFGDFGESAARYEEAADSFGDFGDFGRASQGDTKATDDFDGFHDGSKPIGATALGLSSGALSADDFGGFDTPTVGANGESRAADSSGVCSMSGIASAVPAYSGFHGLEARSPGKEDDGFGDFGGFGEAIGPSVGPSDEFEGFDVSSEVPPAPIGLSTGALSSDDFGGFDSSALSGTALPPDDFGGFDAAAPVNASGLSCPACSAPAPSSMATTDSRKTEGGGGFSEFDGFGGATLASSGPSDDFGDFGSAFDTSASRTSLPEATGGALSANDFGGFDTFTNDVQAETHDAIGMFGSFGEDSGSLGKGADDFGDFGSVLPDSSHTPPMVSGVGNVSAEDYGGLRGLGAAFTGSSTSDLSSRLSGRVRTVPAPFRADSSSDDFGTFGVSKPESSFDPFGAISEGTAPGGADDFGDFSDFNSPSEVSNKASLPSSFTPASAVGSAPDGLEGLLERLLSEERFEEALACKQHINAIAQATYHLTFKLKRKPCP